MTADNPIGPHDLVVSLGDCELIGFCSCGSPLGEPIKPNVSVDVLALRWEGHVMASHRECDCEPCSW